jgi:hypothetical protein
MNDVSSFRYCTGVYQMEAGEAGGMLGQGSFSNLESRQLAVQYQLGIPKQKCGNKYLGKAT